MSGVVPGAGVVRARFLVSGVVQGVGFRPFVWRLATRSGLGGWVENDGRGVRIEVEGAADGVEAFERGLLSPPPRARVERVVAERIPPAGREPFTIRASPRGGGASTHVPPDLAACEACLAEVRDPASRRHRHPFAACTDCGPRFSVIRAMPYDRSSTTLDIHPLCADCAREHADPRDRRFHAEAICCPACGPRAWFEAAAGAPGTAERGEDAVRAARRMVRAGGIVAVKGVGGFHLCCAATDAAAVERLRERKHRPTKPMAILAASLDACRRLAEVSAGEARLLEGPERPIVLLAARPDTPLASAVAPGTGRVGIMLPAFPLHALLVEDDDDPFPPLVMTSGNAAGEPICTANAEALARLASVADGFLLHDRDIHVPCDDSVVTVVAGRPVPVRRSRGFAPLPVTLPSAGPDVIAVGSELKAAPCVAGRTHAWMGQHVGDLSSPASLDALERTIRHLTELFDVRPAAVACDLHPGWLSSRFAADLARGLGVPLERVAHHEAHAAALLADHAAAAAPDDAGAIAVVAALDGTGFREDGSIGGCEFHVPTADSDGDARELVHVATLEPFPLPGGDAAIRHPWRTALALLHSAGVPWDRAPGAARSAGDAAPILRRQLEGGISCVPCTSMGRLFDGVASILGVCHSIGHEAEAATRLEALAAAGRAERDYSFALGGSPGAGVRVAWRPVVAAIAADAAAGHDRAAIARGFHRAVARMVAAVARRVAPGGRGAGLSGGVFQNTLLAEMAIDALGAAGMHAITHRVVPPGDGGIALGQAVVARARLARSAPVTSRGRAS